MRLMVEYPVKDDGRGCSICRGNKNLIKFYDPDDDTLSFFLCDDCVNALRDACIDSGMFEAYTGKVKITPKMACSDADYQSFKAGYREGYRDGFRDNYELHD